MNVRFQMQGGKKILPKETNANRFFWDSRRLEIWSNHLCPSMRPNGGERGYGLVPEFIDPVFTKTSPKRSFSLNRKRAF
jgi:hypothetical protein